jgi:high-affinity Fe2+/Pb2+ permease
MSDRRPTGRAVAIWTVRYGIALVLFIAGWVILLVGESHLRWDGWAMCLGAAGSIVLLNVLFRYGARGDQERVQEESAREYFAAHGHWPDEKPPPGRGTKREAPDRRG